MRSPFRTTIAQFSSEGGRAQPRAANVRAVEPAADLSGAERGNLYMLVEVTGSGGGHAALYRQMLNAAQTAFYEAEGTLASALVRAVRSAHSVLRRANEALPEAGWRAGITCAALQGQELTIAQAGPSLMLIAHPKTVDQFPAGPEEYSISLGGEERPEVELVRTPIEPGSMVLIAQSDWLARIPAETLAAASTAETVGQVSDYLGQLAGDAELSALIFKIENALPQVQDRVAPSGVAIPSRAEVTPGTPATSPRGVRPEAAPEAAQSAAAQSAAGPHERIERSAAPATGQGAAPRRVEQPLQVTLSDDEDVEEDGSLSEAVAEPAVALEERPRRSRWPLIVALIVIPILVVLVILGMWYTRNVATEKQYQDLLQGASAAVAEAQTLPDDATARLRLDAARELMDKADGLRPNDSRLASLEDKYNETLDKIDHVTPLYGVVKLWDFKGDGHHLDRVLTNSNSLFVLDHGQQNVSHFLLSDLGDSVTPGDPAVVISKTQRLKEIAVGDLVDIAWADAVNNQHSRLLALDRSNNLISYDTTWGSAIVPISGRDQWSYPQLLATYSGNLYIVDTKANQIWRYRPSDNGYENPPEPYFSKDAPVDLAGVQSMAIDGNIWLLYADGRLLKFFAGEHKAFELTGMPDPLSAPTAVATAREGDLLYIADGGNGRILEFDKEGKFQRQFRPAEGNLFKDMRGLYLDEATSLFYVLSGDTLYKADLPRQSQ